MKKIKNLMVNLHKFKSNDENEKDAKIDLRLILMFGKGKIE